MKAYLDTNILRQLTRIPENTNVELFCSQLGIMELIAGMTSDKEYAVRKSALENIKRRGITIIWDSVKTLQIKAFALPIQDYDVEATKMLMEEILKTSTLSEAQKISIDYGGETYSLNVVTNYDDSQAEESQATLGRASLISKEDRKSLRKNLYTAPEIRFHTQLAQIEFLKSMGIHKFAPGQGNSPDREFTPEYINSIEHFYKSNMLGDYMKCIAIYILDAMREGRQPGLNDGHDIGHVAYGDKVDLFISDDKIYQRLPHEFFTLEFLKLDEFLIRYYSSSQ